MSSDKAAPASVPRPFFTFESDRIRRTIIASYWIIVLLALPLWWSTTSIQRLSLPRTQVESQAQAASQLSFPVEILLDVGGLVAEPAELADKITKIITERASKALENWNGLDVRIAVDPSMLHNEHHYEVILSKKNDKHEIKDRKLTFHVGKKHSNLSEDVANVICSLIAPYSSRTVDLRVAKYSPRYRLAFTLLNQDVRLGGVRGWGIEDSIQTRLSAMLDQLKPLHNFTIESQVQYFGPLTFDPPKATDGKEDYWALGADELPMFINSEQWTLASSVSNDPVLHLILFIPSEEITPLRVLNPDGSLSRSNAFIIPQWGGVVVYAPPSGSTGAGQAAGIFEMFRQQLLVLLGVPELPSTVVANPSHLLTQWQLDALLRRRSLENVKGSLEAMTSIVKLTDEIENMPIGDDVRGNITEALTALDDVHRTAKISPESALSYSSRALTLSSQAFFNPGMVGLLYFPTEHKYAVYLPLFGPVTVPLLAALIREFKDWRKKRHEKKQKKE